ncbi:MAG: hypothetical protein O2894_04445 [Planctomycetota bacterium]|nr:hypothetical protein [Planctomycetota bacterium]
MGTQRAIMGRYLSLAVLLAVAVTAVLAWPFHAWAGDEGLAALGVAAAVCIVGALVGHGIGGLVARAGPPENAPQATQLAITVRLLLTLALSLPVFLAAPVQTMPFGAALVVHYLAQMALEVFVSLRALGQNPGPHGTPARPPQPKATPPTGLPEAEVRAPPAGATSTPSRSTPSPTTDTTSNQTNPAESGPGANVA